MNFRYRDSGSNANINYYYYYEVMQKNMLSVRGKVRNCKEFVRISLQELYVTKRENTAVLVCLGSEPLA